MRLLLDLQGAQGASRHSGLGRYSLELARALVRGAGAHEVALLVNTRLAESAAWLVEEFTPLLGRHAIHRWQAPEGSAAGHDPQAPRRRLAEAMRAQVIRESGCDALHLGSVFEGWQHDAVTTWPAAWERPATAATLHDLIPLTLRETYLDGLWREAGLVPWYGRCLDEVAACDLLLANSEATREEALRHLEVPRSRVTVIGGGVSAHFRPPARPDPDLLPRLGLRPGFLLYLGAGDPRKNEGTLIDAFARLPAGLRAAHPLAIGHVDPARLGAAARAAGLAEHEFTALPFIPEADLPGLYAACGLLVFPSLAEGFGLPLLEAMACGAPVIASASSAMPEVVGRADALFDPHDPAALARLIQHLFGDSLALGDLAAYGRRRAREFSWDGVASRAWPALAALKPRPVARHGRTSLALVSPLPPAASGIADYTAELIPALARHYNITLVSAAPPGEGLAGRFPWLAEAEFPRHAHRFARILYQIGNNQLHAEALTRLLPRHPGFVTLHDALLDDLQNWLAARESGPARRIESEGYPAHFRAPGTTGSAGLLAAAIGVAAHSHHAIALLEHVHGPDGIAHLRHLPLLRQAFTPLPRAEARAALGLGSAEFVVASFGLATAKKLPVRLCQAMQGLGRLVFVGEASGVEGLPATGRVDAATYRLWLGAADLAVQLRCESRGETSAAAMDALVAGLPLIVNRHGSLAELPPRIAILLAEDAPVAELTEAIARLRRDPAARMALGAAGREWALAELAPAAIAARLHTLIEAAYAAPGLPAALAEARALPLSPKDAAPAAAALVATWSGPRQPRLWLDTSLPEEAIRELLHYGAHPYRPEPCRWHGDWPVTAHDQAWERLGLAGSPLADGPAVITPRDAVLSDDAALTSWAAMQGARCLAWPGSLALLRSRL